MNIIAAVVVFLLFPYILHCIGFDYRKYILLQFAASKYWIHWIPILHSSEILSMKYQNQLNIVFTLEVQQNVNTAELELYFITVLPLYYFAATFFSNQVLHSLGPNIAFIENTFNEIPKVVKHWFCIGNTFARKCQHFIKIGIEIMKYFLPILMSID